MKNYTLISAFILTSMSIQANDQPQQLQTQEDIKTQNAVQALDKIASQVKEYGDLKDIKELKLLVDALPDQTKSKLYTFVDVSLDTMLETERVRLQAAQRESQDALFRNHPEIKIRDNQRTCNLSFTVAASFLAAGAGIQFYRSPDAAITNLRNDRFHYACYLISGLFATISLISHSFAEELKDIQALKLKDQASKNSSENQKESTHS